MSRFRITFLLWLVCLGCSERGPEAPAVHPEIASAFFGVVETELTPAVLVHSASRYLGLFADAEAPSHVAFATRNGPRSFKNGEKLNAAEFEECWLLVWWTNRAPWAVLLQNRPRALTLDRDGLHFSFARGAGDVVVLPLHGSSDRVDTKKWPEFLPREPLLRVRYWAGVLREFPVECENSFSVSNQTITVRQRFRFHSIRDDWHTKPLKLAPISPPLTLAADERLGKKLRELEMPTPFGPYKGIEGVTQWEAGFPLSFTPKTNCAWAAFGKDCNAVPNTTLMGALEIKRWPCIPSEGCIKARREPPAATPKVIALNSNSRLIKYGPE